MKERADRLLVRRGLAASREKAQALIMAGLVRSGVKAIRKPGDLLDEASPLRIEETLPYVGRGGLKLEEALDRFGLDPAGGEAVDIGSSTGGFTDCLLKRGAAKVYAVDVDTRQLDWGLRRDPRVVPVEKNARYLRPEDIGGVPRLITLDVSFISLLKILPALRAIPGDWPLVALIKPQFEAGPRDVGKRGIVRDPEVHEQVLERVVRGARDLGFGLRGLIRCSTRGQKGNVEFLGCFVKAESGPDPVRAAEMIKEAARDETH